MPIWWLIREDYFYALSFQSHYFWLCTAVQGMKKLHWGKICWSYCIVSPSISCDSLAVSNWINLSKWLIYYIFNNSLVFSSRVLAAIAPWISVTFYYNSYTIPVVVCYLYYKHYIAWWRQFDWQLNHCSSECLLCSLLPWCKVNISITLLTLITPVHWRSL